MTTSVKPNPQEFVKTLRSNNGIELYKEAYRSGQSFSAWLEEQHPKSEYKDGLDAFDRLLMLSDLRTQADGEQAASRFGDFEEKGLRSLVPEWMARQWRKVSLRRNVTGRRDVPMFMANDDANSQILHPYSDVGERPRTRPLTAAVPLDALIAYTTPLDTDAYIAYYIEDADADELRMVRIGEGAEIPRAKIRAGEFTIRMHKYGRGLEMSYEQLRRQRLDKVSLWMQRLAIQTEHDIVATALDVMINGDGNPNTAADVYVPSDLVTGSTNLTLKVWLAFMLKFESPYMLTTALSQPSTALELMLLDIGTANVPVRMLPSNFGIGGFSPLNNQLAAGVGLGWLSIAPSKKIVAFDAGLALERVYEIGAEINEVERYVTRQTQVLVMTEVEGYSVFDPGAAKILDLN